MNTSAKFHGNRSTSEPLKDKVLTIKRYINSSVYFYFTFTNRGARNRCSLLTDGQTDGRPENITPLAALRF